MLVKHLEKLQNKLMIQIKEFTMQLLLKIKDDKIFDKLLWMLERLKSDGVEIETIGSLKDNQKDVQEYDVDYERSFQYKLDRAEFAQMKERL